MKRFWLRLLALLVLCALSSGSFAESADRSSAGTAQSRSAGGILADTRFPDMNFRTALDERYGDEDHFVDFNRKETDVSGCGIRDLTGIGFFTRLEELDVSDSELASIARTIS